MGFKSLFPTSIWQGRLAPALTLDRLNRELRHDIKVLMELDEEGWRWAEKNYVGGYTSYASMANLHKRFAPFMELEERLTRQVQAYARAQHWDLQAPLEMTDCWVNVMPPLVHHSLHLHPRSLVSGTYYVTTPKGGGALKFEDPRLGLLMAAPARRPNGPASTQAFYRIEPKAGEAILWESWLRHEVSANRGRGTRISISFNYA